MSHLVGILFDLCHHPRFTTNITLSYPFFLSSKLSSSRILRRLCWFLLAFSDAMTCRQYCSQESSKLSTGPDISWHGRIRTGRRHCVCGTKGCHSTQLDICASADRNPQGHLCAFAVRSSIETHRLGYRSHQMTSIYWQSLEGTRFHHVRNRTYGHMPRYGPKVDWEGAQRLRDWRGSSSVH